MADTPDDLIFEHLQGIAFPDQPLGRSILGTAKTVRIFDGGQVARLSGAATIARRALWSAPAGAVDHAAVVAEVEKRFASFNGPAGASAGAGALRRRHACGKARTRTGAYRAGAAGRVSRPIQTLYSLQVFTNILGGGMSSRLFQEAREKRGLCYSIYSFHYPYSDVGMFGLYAGTDAADTSELMRLIVDEIANAAETISEPRSRGSKRR